MFASEFMHTDKPLKCTNRALNERQYGLKPDFIGGLAFQKSVTLLSDVIGGLAFQTSVSLMYIIKKIVITPPLKVKNIKTSPKYKTNNIHFDRIHVAFHS